MKSEGFNSGKALMEVIVFGACTIGIIGASVWSFFQTWLLFYNSMGGDYWASMFLALMVQYGQNLFLFLSQRTTSMSFPWVLCYVGWAFCAAIDAATNLQQWNDDNRAIVAKGGLTPTIMQALMIGLIFSEELASAAMGAMFHSINNLRISLGYEADERLEWAETTSKSFGFGRGKGNGGSGQQSRVPPVNQKQPNKMPPPVAHKPPPREEPISSGSARRSPEDIQRGFEEMRRRAAQNYQGSHEQGGRRLDGPQKEE